MVGFRRPKLWIAAVAMCAAVLGGYFALAHRQYSEARSIASGVKSFKELSDRFDALAKEKSAPYAYDVLRRAALPDGTDVHLLGHTIGDELYKQEGVRGITVCTQEFRNACSHAIVIGALIEFGAEHALGLIRDACEKAPGGSGAYTMCFHGLGHGVFAYYGYDLTKTIAFCKRTGTKDHEDREYGECVGGAIMELMGGGGHDHDLWEKARARYLSDADPLAPCSSAAVPDDVKGMCYLYITPHLFEANGGNLSAPNVKEFAAAFRYCGAIPSASVALREACFGGIGKEFPVLALGRDIRAVNAIPDDAFRKMHAWCALAPHKEARVDCEREIVSSLYWGGETDPRQTIRYCELDDADSQRACFAGMFEEAKKYAPTSMPRGDLCDIVPSPYRDMCQEQIL